MISNTNIFKALSHSIVNNIFWKWVTRPFRCVYVNCLNLVFFAAVSTKLKKSTFLDNLKIIFQEGNMKTTQMTLFFSSTFSAPPAWSSLNLKILKIHFKIHYFSPFLSVKYLNFSPKGTDLDNSSYFSWKYTPWGY